jgi:hypothetical protein
MRVKKDKKGSKAEAKVVEEEDEEVLEDNISKA